jgi:hypothetical protein
MLSRQALVASLLILPFVACDASSTTPPASDAGGIDGGVLDATVDAAGDATGDARDAGPEDATADADDASFPPVVGACGAIHPAAAADGLFYEALALYGPERRGDSLLTQTGAAGSWVLWSTRTRTRIAEGAGAAVSFGDMRPQLRGDVFLVPAGTGFETRDAQTGAVLHAFAAPAANYKAALGFDGSYVGVVTDAGISLYTPGGALIRSVASADLPLPDLLPYSSGMSTMRSDGVWFGQGQYLVLVPKNAATAPSAAGPFDGQLDNFTQDGSHAVWLDTYIPETRSFRDVDGNQRGTGIGMSVSWGNYAWTTSGTDLTLYSIAGATAVPLGTYPMLGTDYVISSSGYLMLQSGVLSLRGATPVLTPVPSFPAGAGGGFSVDPASGAWAIEGASGMMYGNALSFAAYGTLGCARLQAVAGTQSGTLVLGFADHVERIDAVSGTFLDRRDIPTKTRLLVSEQGTMAVSDEPAAYELPTWTKVGTFAAADGVPLALSPDGTRVALAKGGIVTLTSVDERNPRGGALLASRPSTVRGGDARPAAIYSPDGTKLAVAREVIEPGYAGAPILVTTDLYAIGTTASGTCTHYPVYWQDNDTLATELLPSGSRNPPTWNAFAGTCVWNGSGAVVQTPGASLGNRGGPDFSKYQRRNNGLLFKETPPSVRDLTVAGAPWAVPDGTTRLSRDRVGFAGRSFFWIAPTNAPGPAGVHRHTF